ncbi:hypothetical protein CTheo_1639 [Ceratobasidium theobromae]|uniref:Uncharacterized protein n=1 Tax=Ceratobasidium theobromae TaxID=1582974 RepID=A0A5N5QV02_9AGAM|nr:hypothetical protein CTheo_1639 [Ceratobasidium theobromae]
MASTAGIADMATARAPHSLPPDRAPSLIAQIYQPNLTTLSYRMTTVSSSHSRPASGRVFSILGGHRSSDQLASIASLPISLRPPSDMISSHRMGSIVRIATPQTERAREPWPIQSEGPHKD